MRLNATDYRMVLSSAALSYRGSRNRPAPEQVVQALLEAEKTAKKQRILYAFEQLFGQWRLCFSTGTRKAQNRAGIVLGKGFYVPKIAPARIAFASGTSDERGEITNQVQAGFFTLKLIGLTQYSGKKNLLAFDFTRLQIEVLDRAVYSGAIRGGKDKAAAFYETSISTLPFFAFFLVTDDFIAARGRGGGLALWIKENPNQA